MARITLWEDTIITALRDMQWLNLQRLSRETEDLVRMMRVYPPGFLKLDGHAESSIGDVAMKEGERFFLIEVKSEEHAVRDEWQAGPAKDQEKELLARLKGLPEANEPMFKLCLRGHFVAYWSGARKRPKEHWVPGEIVTEPYYLACARLRRNCDVAEDVGLDHPGIKYSIGVVLEADLLAQERTIAESLSAYLARAEQKADKPTRPTIPQTTATLLDLFSSKVSVGVRVNATRLHAPQPAGLEAEEFQAYLTFLTAHRTETPVHAVVLTSHGSFFRVVADTAHLAALLDGKLGPEAKRGPSVDSHDATHHLPYPTAAKRKSSL